jgi:hypothetical protein
MIKANLKVIYTTDNNYKSESSVELSFVELYLDEADRLVKSSFIELTKNSILPYILFKTIEDLGSKDIVQTLLTELNNDLEYGVEECGHLQYVNPNISIDLVLV